MFKRSIKAIGVVLIVGALAGCAGTAQTRATTGLAIACDTYATVLDQLTPKKATLSAAVVARIDSTNKLVNPVCKPDSIVDPATAVTIVQSGITLLNTIKGDN